MNPHKKIPPYGFFLGGEGLQLSKNKITGEEMKGNNEELKKILLKPYYLSGFVKKNDEYVYITIPNFIITDIKEVL